MKSHFSVPVIITGLLAIAGASFFLARTAKAQVQLAAFRRPFTIFLSEKHYETDANGTVLPAVPAKVAGSLIRARRNDGSLAELVTDTSYLERKEASILGGMIHNVAERKTIRFNTASRSRTTLSLSDQEAIAVKAVAADSTCRTLPKLVEPAQMLGTGTFNGLPVVKLQLAGNPGSTTRVEVWLSPDLDCEPLVQKIWFRRTARAPFSALSVREAVRIDTDEPEAYLFQPTGAIERMPSDYFRSLGDGATAAAGSSAKAKLQMLDGAYRSRSGGK